MAEQEKDKRPKIKPSPHLKGQRATGKNEPKNSKSFEPEKPTNESENTSLLTKCDECEGEFNQSELRCPSCGAPNENNENPRASSTEKGEKFTFLDDIYQVQGDRDQVVEILDNATEKEYEDNEPSPTEAVPKGQTVRDEKPQIEEDIGGDISKRKGNYILTIGLPGSGKTTVQSFMTYTALNYSKGKLKGGRLFPSFNLNHIPHDDGTRNVGSESIVDEWEESWRDNKFPDATAVGESNIREIRLKFDNNENKKQSFELSFLEVSGEDLNKVKANKDWKVNLPVLVEKLNKFLTNPNIKKNFVFVVDPKKPKENDGLFRGFNEHVKTIKNIKKKDIGLIIVISDPRAALEHIKKRKKYENMDLEEFSRSRIAVRLALKDFAPWTRTLYDGWNEKKKRVMLFDIGEVENRDKGTFLIEPKFVHSRQFIEWHFQQFTGQVFKQTWKNRLRTVLGT